MQSANSEHSGERPILEQSPFRARLVEFAARQLAETGAAPRDVVLQQRGEIRLKPRGRWLPFTAEQWASCEEVSFRWRARVKMAPATHVVVEDVCERGKGHLDAKVWGAVTLAHGEGPDVDRGEAQRYLAELAWNPFAVQHNRQLCFGRGEDGEGRVWCGDPDTYVDLDFDQCGEVVLRAFTRTRVRDGGQAAPWEGRFFDYEPVGGVRLPKRGSAAWLLPEGRHEYWRATITGVRWVEPGARPDSFG